MDDRRRDEMGFHTDFPEVAALHNTQPTATRQCIDVQSSHIANKAIDPFAFLVAECGSEQCALRQRLTLCEWRVRRQFEDWSPSQRLN